MQPIVLPYGPPVDVPMDVRPVHTSIDFENDSLRLKRECFTCLLREWILFHTTLIIFYTSFLRRETQKNIRKT